MDNDESRSALYEKPRRIIQNQVLIQLLIILSVATPMPLALVMFWLAFGVAPAIVIPSILVVWVAGSVSYAVIRLWAKLED
jgi:hypothetical protein